MGSMTARGFGLAAAIVALGAALTSCGTVAGTGTPSGSASGSASPTVTASPSTSVAVPQDPTALVGGWVVSDARGGEPGTVLLLGVELTVWRSCGFLMGSWRASTASLFAASVSGGDEKCFAEHGDEPAPAWLTAATRFQSDGAGVVLLDSEGGVVARLSPGGSPTPGPNILPSNAVPPVLTDELRAWLAPPSPLSSSLTPATRARLLGSWVVADPSATNRTQRQTPGILFAQDGTYQATDGCNGTAGRWTADDSGGFLLTGGATTAIGCDNVEVAQPASGAAWAAFDGDVLVMVGPSGKELIRLRRA